MNVLKKLALGAVIIFVVSIFVFARAAEYSGQTEKVDLDSIKITILYDNYVHTPGTIADWGFSCLIEGIEKTILFDTGTKSDILWHNIRKLGIDINKVEQIVISHIHGDHTGGLASVLKKKHNVPVYIPASFPDAFVQKVESTGAKAVRVSKPIEICKDIFLTGEMGEQIKEQSLILNTSQGLVVITGCSHPGIVNIVKKAEEILHKKVYFALGGFHLMAKSEKEIKQIIAGFKSLGVTKCGGTHCTGDKAIALFRDAFGSNCVSMGVGKIVRLNK